MSSHATGLLDREIWQRSRASISARPDIHTRLMAKYPDIPQSWWYSLLVVTIGLSSLLCVVFKKQIQLPWWGLLLACALAAGFTLPVAVITATTNQVTYFEYASHS